MLYSKAISEKILIRMLTALSLPLEIFMADHSNQTSNYFSSLDLIKHSFNTPLTSLMINLELALELQAQSFKLSQPKKNYTQYLQNALLCADYLKAIMNSDQTQLLKKPQFRIKSAMMQVINMVKKAQTKVQIINFITLNKQLKLAGSKLYFQEALICLINNACEAYDEQAPNRLVMLWAQQQKQQLELKIVDAGRGFLQLADTLAAGKKINWHQLETTKSDHLGLGLKFVKKVVMDHFKGQLQIRTQPNKGTTISWRIPLAR